MAEGSSYLEIYSGSYGYNLDMGQSGFSRFNISDTGDLLLNHPSGSPTITGGTTDSAGLTLKSTAATGINDFIRMVVGNNGSIEALTVSNPGYVGIGSTTPSSIFSVGDTGGINFSTATSTFSSSGGINLAAGCFAVRGVCVGNSTASGSGYSSIEDEGGALTTRTVLNFSGSGVSCADDTTKTTCTINAGAASAGGSTAQFQFNDGGSLGGGGQDSAAWWRPTYSAVSRCGPFRERWWASVVCGAPSQHHPQPDRYPVG
jgi:hypothetical protein